MATISREYRRREAPAGQRTYNVNGVLRVSPAWRQRSRSYTPDQVLYRMGMRKNAQGEWVVVAGQVPQGLVDAMRGMRTKSEVLVKRQMDEESGIFAIAPGDAKDDTAVLQSVDGVSPSRNRAERSVKEEIGEDEYIQEHRREGSVDMTDAVEILEEIRVYIDVDRWVASHMDHGEEEESVVQSVEVKTDYKAEVDIATQNNEAGFRNSLVSISEATEEDVFSSPAAPVRTFQAPHGDHFRADCATCARLKDKPSLLRKHLLRASKPYFCPIVPHCNRSFASKLELMRHHNSTHWPFERFICAISRPEDSSWPCGRSFSEAKKLQEHLMSAHGKPFPEAKGLAQSMRVVEPNYPHVFWCGICVEAVQLGGVPEVRRNSMFSHLANHMKVT